jgi:dihydroxyacid dehydratase/phosphogluconate dehydratase
MEEIYQTDRRTALPAVRQARRDRHRRQIQRCIDGACIGHVSPEALAGDRSGRSATCDLIEIAIDCEVARKGALNFLWNRRQPRGRSGRRHACSHAAHPGRISRPIQRCQTTHGSGRPCRMPAGGPWGGCVVDADAIVDALNARKR